MEIIRIPSENPIQDQWRLLSQFTYPQNIQNYLSDNGHNSPDTQLIEYIAGCVRQGHAYFIASAASNLDISPLLSYYGAANLLAGVSALISGQRKEIAGHGMKLRFTQPLSMLANAEVIPTDPANGGLQHFSNIFSDGCDLSNGGTWSLEELFASIPDLQLEFLTCYSKSVPYVLPLDRNPDRRAEFHHIQPSAISRFASLDDALSRVLGFNEAYLKPQWQRSMNQIVLYPKARGSEIGTLSIFGQTFLELAHTKNGHLLNPNQLLIMHMGLYALGYLSRYHPELWNPFVRSDTTGERLVVESFILLCNRFIPNLILCAIRGEQIRFMHAQEPLPDITNLITEAEVKRLIQDMKARGELK